MRNTKELNNLTNKNFLHYWSNKIIIVKKNSKKMIDKN